MESPIHLSMYSVESQIHVNVSFTWECRCREVSHHRCRLVHPGSNDPTFSRATPPISYYLIKMSYWQHRYCYIDTGIHLQTLTYKQYPQLIYWPALREVWKLVLKGVFQELEHHGDHRCQPPVPEYQGLRNHILSKQMFCRRNKYFLSPCTSSQGGGRG